MSNDLNYFEQVSEGENIDDFLVSLASGLASAQQQLSELTANDAMGSSGVSYQIPRLDFELSLQIHTESSTTENSPGHEPKRRRKTRVQSINTSSNDVTANSTLKGSFVAVPVNGGRPKPIINLSFSETDSHLEVVVTIGVVDTTGEPQKGVHVEVNVDRELSFDINQREGLDHSLSSKTYIRSGVVSTDALGVATAVLAVAKDEAAGVNVAVTADVKGATASLIYRTGNKE